MRIREEFIDEVYASVGLYFSRERKIQSETLRVAEIFLIKKPFPKIIAGKGKKRPKRPARRPREHGPLSFCE